MPDNEKPLLRMTFNSYLKPYTETDKETGLLGFLKVLCYDFINSRITPKSILFDHNAKIANESKKMEMSIESEDLFSFTVIEENNSIFLYLETTYTSIGKSGTKSVCKYSSGTELMPKVMEVNY